MEVFLRMEGIFKVRGVNLFQGLLSHFGLLSCRNNNADENHQKTE